MLKLVTTLIKICWLFFVFDNVLMFPNFCEYKSISKIDLSILVDHGCPIVRCGAYRFQKKKDLASKAQNESYLFIA